MALHPANVESVQWISGLDDVLVATFILSALLAHGYGKKIPSYCLFMLALLTKETALVAPLLLLAMDYWRGDLAESGTEPVQTSGFSTIGTSRSGIVLKSCPGRKGSGWLLKSLDRHL